ncbi:MAG: Stk1 family PASTA domain-containing Ser/Thr kinase [Clostridia bacterium]|nr:Stk1 family PASTA domain-containing Ser/Thr kinase [Clostridia bacterium]
MDKYLGKRLDGRYEIREIIGVGGMAVVYKAFDNLENRFVAIKILKEEFLSNQEFLRRFKNESKAIAMLSHPNIVSVYDVSFGDLIQYIVMEYIEGITLKEFIEREGSLRWKDAVHFAIQILKGLQHAHDRGIVHRDVKPQNIMVLSDGTIKVTDFGIARFARSDQRTITDKAIGSVHYISPEQARGEKTDERTDIYSVGVMLYEMLTGKLPFQAESAVSVAIMQLQREPQLPSEVNGSIPLGLEQITMHAMQKSVDRRYQSASEILCDLSNFRKDPSITFPYTYFVDDAPTKYVGGVSDVVTDDSETHAKQEKNSLIPILTGVAIAVVAAIIVLAAIFIPKLFASTGDEFKCPNFVGQNFEDIQNNEEYKGKFIFTFEPKASDEYEENIVVEQSITEGSPLKEGTKITLYYSSGKTLVEIPNVYGYTEAAAKTELEDINDFKVVIKQEFNEDVETGIVIKTEPQRGNRVPKGSKIEVYVSSGKEVVSVDIPNVVGEPIVQAKNKIEDANLKVEVENVNLTPADSNQPKDYVLRQEPQGGSEKVPEGTTITLYVSSGLYETDIQVSVPSVYPQNICQLSLWLNGTCVKTGESINLSQVKNYTFKDITSENKSENYTIMIKSENGTWEDYQSISVDFRKERDNVIITSTNTFDAPSVPSDSSNQQNVNSSLDNSSNNTNSSEITSSTQSTN